MRGLRQNVLRKRPGGFGRAPLARPGLLTGRVLPALALVVLTVAPAFAFRGEAEAGKGRRTEPAQRESAAFPQLSAEQGKAAQAAANAGVRVTWQAKKGIPSSVRGDNLGGRKEFPGRKALKAKGGGAYREDAVAALDKVAPLFRIRDVEKEFEAASVKPDALGFRHARMRQVYQGLPVVGGELIVHFDRKDQVYEVNGQYVPDIVVDIVPALKAGEAEQAARADLAGKGVTPGALAGKPVLVVYARGAAPRLAYELAIASDDGRNSAGLWRYWIDAQTGAVLSSFNDVKRIAAPTANGVHATLTGDILLGEGGGTVSVQGWHENAGAYYLYNTNYSWLVYNVAETGYTDADTFAFRTSSSWGTTDRAEMSSARGFDLIQKYYRQVHGRDSFDALGALAIVNVHQGENYVNAFWSPFMQQFYIGDGDGVEANSLAVLDVLAHEFTHAVTENTCNLTYAFESGALNESFSDIFGVCAEFFGQPDGRTSYPGRVAGTADWLMGEDCWLSTTALRDMRNPANTATVGMFGAQPTLYQGTYWYAGFEDNGGVHQNSGVQNFFFYLLCEGGSGVNDGNPYNVTGIGIAAAEQVAYRTLSVYCTADTDYEAARAAWISAALDLNTNWVRSVKQAWNAVLGITPPVLYSPSALPNGRVGTYYNYTLGLAGGVSPYTWTRTAGSLPSNLTFSDGVVSGMPDTPTTVSFSVSVTDDDGQQTAKDYTLTILPPYGIPFYETFEHAGDLPEAWSQENVEGDWSWVFRTGSPQGHPVNAYSNQYNAFFGVENPTQYVTRLVSPQIDFGADARAAQLTFWYCNESWINSQDELRIYYKTAVDGDWTLIDSCLTSVSKWTKRTVTLPEPGRSYFVAFEGKAKYGYGICLDEIRIFDPTPPLSITSASPLPDAITEQDYSYALEAEGGTAPYTFEVVSGSLPDGFSLSAEGVLSGVSATVQSSTFTVMVTDFYEETALKSFEFAVILPRADIFAEDFENMGYIPTGWTQEYVTNAVQWTFRVGAPFGHPSAPVSGNLNACFFSSAWVNGGSFDQKTKLVSPMMNLGQAPASIKLTFWQFMEQWDGGQDELRIYYRTITNTPWILLPDATYLTSVASWTKRTVMLPNPSQTYQIAFEGNAHFGYGVCLDDIRVSDASDAPLITTGSPLPPGVIGLAYSTVLAASGGAQPYTWSVLSGSLPAGLALNSSSGEISGMPTTAGVSSFRIKVLGGDGKSTTNQFALTVSAARIMPFTETFENGGVMPFGWSQEYISGTLNWVFRSGSPVSPGVPSAAHSNSLYNACLFYNNSNGRVSRLISPMLNVGSGTNAQARLTFWHCMAKYINDQDQLKVLYRNSVTSSWEVLASYVLNTAAWTERTLDLPNASPTYFIAFEGLAKYGYGVCIDNVTVTGNSAMSPYETWKLNMFGADAGDESVSGDDADPDGDGIPNALEYAMGLNPMSYDTEGLPFGGVTAGYLTLSFRMDKDALDAGVRFDVEACTNMIEQAWSPANVSEQLPRADSNEWWQAVFQHDVPVTNAPQRFMRLKVTLP